MICCALESLDKRDQPLSTTDTHLNAVATLAALELIEQVGHDPATGGTDSNYVAVLWGAPPPNGV